MLGLPRRRRVVGGWNSRYPIPASEFRRRSKRRFSKRSRRLMLLPHGVSVARDWDYRFAKSLCISWVGVFGWRAKKGGAANSTSPRRCYERWKTEAPAERGTEQRRR